VFCRPDRLRLRLPDRLPAACLRLPGLRLRLPACLRLRPARPDRLRLPGLRLPGLRLRLPACLRPGVRLFGLCRFSR